ncbi:hypothetical protein Tco_1061137 [Tanacetum coccineum]
MLTSPEQTATVHHGLLPFLEVTFQDTQTDCVQDTAQRMKLKRLKASTAFKSRQTDAEQRRPTIKKLEVKQVEFKLGEDCWEKQVNYVLIVHLLHSLFTYRHCRGVTGNHPLRFSIDASSSVPWIYLGAILAYFERRWIKLPQATDINHARFVPDPTFSEMVPFYINDLGFTLDISSPSNFKTTGLVQSWQTLCKMFSRCLTIRVTGYDQPPLQIIHMLYCFVNNIHVDYADLR